MSARHPLAHHFPADIEQLIHDYANAFDESVIMAKSVVSAMIWYMAVIQDGSMTHRSITLPDMKWSDCGHTTYYNQYRSLVGLPDGQPLGSTYCVDQRVYWRVDDTPLTGV